MIVYGPVPSRRLGQSLGINHILPKTCSYLCIYCQIGSTDKMCIQRQAFYDPEEIYRETAANVQKRKKRNKESITCLLYLTENPSWISIWEKRSEQSKIWT